MRHHQTFSHRYGEEALRSAGVLDEVLAAVDAESVLIGSGSSNVVKQHVITSLIARGWAPNAQLVAGVKIGVNAVKKEVGLTVQTGNIARAFYDILKFQGLFSRDRIRAAVLITPSSHTSGLLSTDSSNRASFDRISRELQLYYHVVTMPLVLISFE